MKRKRATKFDVLRQGFEPRISKQIVKNLQTTAALIKSRCCIYGYSRVLNTTVGNPYSFLVLFPPTWPYLELLVYKIL